jgi:V/A-type H+/Na+-transporting ATPase subunit E
MDSKLQELTDKIYREGVEKGEQQAQEIISAAEKQSAAIIEGARREAKIIIAEAQKKAGDLQQTMESDMRLAASQCMNSLKQQILDVITARVVEQPLTESLSDAAAMTSFLKTILKNWEPAVIESSGIEVLLPESQRDRLAAAMEAGLSQELTTGLKLCFTKNFKAGFQVQLSGSSYKISFTDENFKEYFCEYLRPKMRAFLFGE